MTDLLADKQKKKGGRKGTVTDFFSQPEKNLLQNYHNGLGVLSSSMYMTELWADKQKTNKQKQIMGGGGQLPPFPPSPPKKKIKKN